MDIKISQEAKNELHKAIIDSMMEIDYEFTENVDFNIESYLHLHKMAFERLIGKLDNIEDVYIPQDNIIAQSMSKKIDNLKLDMSAYEDGIFDGTLQAITGIVSKGIIHSRYKSEDREKRLEQVIYRELQRQLNAHGDTNED